MNPLAQVMMQLGMQMGSPQGGPLSGKPPAIGTAAFDKRFAGAPGNPGMGPLAFPVDDNALMRLRILRQHMIDLQRGYPNDTPLIGELAAPFPVRP